MMRQTGVTHGVCWCGPGAGHDVDYDVLFDGEWSRVKRDAKEGNTRHVTSPQVAHEEGQKDGNELDFEEGT